MPKNKKVESQGVASIRKDFKSCETCLYGWVCKQYDRCWQKYWEIVEPIKGRNDSE